MDTLGIKKISSPDQYVLFGVYFSKKMDSMPGNNTMKCLYFPTLEMAKDVYLTLQHFIWNFNRGYNGGELRNGLRVFGQEILGEVPYGAIDTTLFTQINDEQLLSSNGYMMNIPTFVERSKQLMNHVCNLRNQTIPNYDEHFLTVLRITGFLPRIKRTNFTFNLWAYDYIETDEKTVREMGLVLSETHVFA
jgi:hypothetical protein